MTMSPETAADLRKSAAAATVAAAEAGAHAAAVAVSSAAVNAAKPGGKSSELKATAAAIGVTVGLIVLHTLSLIPGPWMVPALAISTGISAGAYALSRGNVKAAALTAAGAAAAAAFPKAAPAIANIQATAGTLLGLEGQSKP